MMTDFSFLSALFLEMMKCVGKRWRSVARHHDNNLSALTLTYTLFQSCVNSRGKQGISLCDMTCAVHFLSPCGAAGWQIHLVQTALTGTGLHDHVQKCWHFTLAHNYTICMGLSRKCIFLEGRSH